MAKQVVTITMNDAAAVESGSPVDICIECEGISEHGSMSYLTALALRNSLPDILRLIGEQIASDLGGGVSTFVQLNKQEIH
ncbi:TPA: hypothetical protein IGZ61_002263 [Escherichia coli]|nr:hypothetical protein [Escherichia coli]